MHPLRLSGKDLHQAKDAFDLYHQLHEEPPRPIPYLTGPALPSVGHAVAGAIGSAVSNICTYPLALVVTRLQTQNQSTASTEPPVTDNDEENYTSFSDAISKIYHHDGGLRGFTPGLWPDTAKTIADAFIFFLVYDSIRRSRVKSKGLGAGSDRLPVLDELTVGFVAGATSKFLTTPLATIVTRRQTSTSSSSRKSRGSEDVFVSDTFAATASDIWNEKGLAGFWSGYSASLILTLNPSLTFFTFERLKLVLVPSYRRSHLSPRETFLFAALSKAIASNITYPFSLAKSRMQSKSGVRGRPGGIKSPTAVTHPDSRKPYANVLSTIASIARTEGAGALYRGLSGEVFKGFFSHGITMLVKGSVHKLVVRLFYVVLRLLRIYPDPVRLAELAQERAERVAIKVARKGVENTSAVLR